MGLSSTPLRHSFPREGSQLAGWRVLSRDQPRERVAAGKPCQVEWGASPTTRLFE